jgi:hypothetical protein
MGAFLGGGGGGLWIHLRLQVKLFPTTNAAILYNVRRTCHGWWKTDMHEEFWWETRRKEKLRVDGKIILKFTLKNCNRGAGIEFVWPSRGAFLLFF